MATYNRFGATTAQLVAMFPGTVSADFGGDAAIQAVQERIAREIAGALVPIAYRVLAEDVTLELVEDYASAGQTSVTVGLVPVVTGTIRLWRFSRDAELRTKPRKGVNELTVSAIVLATGVVTISDTINLGDKVFASYEIDAEAAAFSWPSVADAVLHGSAALLGSRMYTSAEQQEWALVTDYRAKYAGRIGSVGEDGVMRMAREGRWQPDELRTLKWWNEIDTADHSIGSIDLMRG
ncbi:hypothetical protein [Methylibium sp.]|uniref:hypothetical protein n=1 Tax=Methylibium sp. TaxID=2067992 RepID=UPI0017E2097B|nr:hypothetical protein [Methylibium sp.]MBA3588846.1 hypothetical protein [Methylibium sp.]